MDDRLHGAVPHRGPAVAVPADAAGGAQPLPAGLRGAPAGVGAGHAGYVAKGVPGARLAGAAAQRQRQPVRLGRGRPTQQAGRVVAAAGHRVGADPARQAAAERASRAHAPRAQGQDSAAAGRRSASTASAPSTTSSARARCWRSGRRPARMRVRPGSIRNGCRMQNARCTGSGTACAGTVR